MIFFQKSSNVNYFKFILLCQGLCKIFQDIYIYIIFKSFEIYL
jgi:hypothetical protein